MHRGLRKRVGRAVAGLAAVVSLMVVPLAGCSDPTNSGAETGDGGGPLNVFMYQKPVGTFGSLAANSGPDIQVRTLIHDSLLYPSPQGDLKLGAAAAEPEVSDDGKTITFTLKEGLTFSDGEPITSDDLLFTYTRAADPNTASAKATFMTNVVGVQEFSEGTADTIAGISAPDPQTLVIEQTVNAPSLVEQIGTVGILPEHALKDLPVQDFATNTWFQAPEVTSGPFSFVEYKTDQYVHVEANENFREDVGVQDIFLKPVEASVATQQLSTGEMDIASIPATDRATVDGFENVTVQEQPSTSAVVVSWNQRQERFRDPRVKQAFLHAVNREGIVDSALLGQGSVRNSLWPEKWSADDLNTYEYDPEKAKALLEEAGFDFSQPVELAWIPGGNPDRDAAAIAIEDQLNAIGVKLELKQVQASFFTEVYSSHEFDMVLYGGVDYGVVPANAGPVSNCDQATPVGPNTGGYCNPELDAAIAEASTQVEDDAKVDAFEKASVIENEDPALMWLYDLTWNVGVSNRVQNFQLYSNETWFEPWTWTVTE